MLLQPAGLPSVVDEYLGLRGAEDGEDGGDLVDLVLPREQGVLGVEFEQDAANAPDIHFLGVEAVGEQALRGSVPPRRDVLGERLRRMDVCVEGGLLLHEPKSANFISLSPVTRMFSGFMSRWKMPFSCRKAVA